MSEGWIVLKLLRTCPRCSTEYVRVFENARTKERRCTACMLTDADSVPCGDSAHG